MPRPSWSMRRAAFGAAMVPMIAFAAPRAQAPADVQSLAATNQVIVPFEHNARQNALMIRATINNRPALLLLDTGARNSIISREIAGMTGGRPRAVASQAAARASRARRSRCGRLSGSATSSGTTIRWPS